MIYVLGTRRHFEYYCRANRLDRTTVRHIAKIEDCYGVRPHATDTVVWLSEVDPHLTREIRVRFAMRDLFP